MPTTIDERCHRAILAICRLVGLVLAAILAYLVLVSICPGCVERAVVVDSAPKQGSIVVGPTTVPAELVKMEIKPGGVTIGPTSLPADTFHFEFHIHPGGVVITAPITASSPPIPEAAANRLAFWVGLTAMVGMVLAVIAWWLPRPPDLWKRLKSKPEP